MQIVMITMTFNARFYMCLALVTISNLWRSVHNNLLHCRLLGARYKNQRLPEEDTEISEPRWNSNPWPSVFWIGCSNQWATGDSLVSKDHFCAALHDAVGKFNPQKWPLLVLLWLILYNLPLFPLLYNEWHRLLSARLIKIT